MKLIFKRLLNEVANEGRENMKNYIKAYLITVLINDILIIGLNLYAYSDILRFYFTSLIAAFLAQISLSVAQNTLRLLALMFIIILPSFKLITKYPPLAYGVSFCAGFLVSMIIYIVGWVFAGDLTMISLIISVAKAVIFAFIFTALYWWLNRPRKRTTKNIIKDLS